MAEFINELGRLLGENARQRFVLRLYVTGTTRQSGRAIANLTALCETWLKGRYDLEVIDLYQHRELARQHEIVVAPTLVKQLPAPFRRLIGDLSDTPQVLLALGVQPNEATNGPAGQASVAIPGRAPAKPGGRSRAATRKS